MKKSLIWGKLLILGLLLFSISSCKNRDIDKIKITNQDPIKAEESNGLQVTHVSPTGFVEGEREASKILIGFNQVMTPLQVVPREEIEGPLEIQPSVEGKYRWLGTRTLSFIPTKGFQSATEYKVTLKKDKIQSLKGERLKEDVSWSFETVRPNLISSLPYHGEEFVDLKTKIYLNFNLEMSPERVGDKIKIFATHSHPSRFYCGSRPHSSVSLREEIPFKVRNLKDSEKEDWPLKEWENEKTLVLLPDRSLPIESKIEVHIYPGLLAKTGNLGVSMSRVLTFNTYNVFVLANHSTEIQADSPLELCFSNRVVIKDVLENMSIQPSLEIPDEYKEQIYSTHNVRFDLPFKPNSEYKIKINESLKDIYGNNLDKTYEFTLKVKDYAPYASIPTGINILESKGSLCLPATFRNVDKVYLEMGMVDPKRAIPFLRKPNLFDPHSKYEAPSFFKISRPWVVNTYKNYPNKRLRLPIELKEILGERSSGLCFVQFDNMGYSRNDQGRYLKSFIQLTDLGVTWKYSPENNLVWVTSLNSGNPIKDVKIEFRSEDNKVVAEGITDEFGLCELKGWATAKLKEKKEVYEREDEYEMYSNHYWREPNFWILASKGGDNSIYSKNWIFGIDLWRFDIPYNWSVRAEEYGVYIFTEKGLYRSGETVHIKGIVRKKSGGRWVLPDLKDISFTVKNSREEKVIEKKLPVNATGSFFKDLRLSKDAPTGVYSILVTIPEKNYNFFHSFRVEAFRPAEFEVNVSSEKDVFLAKETFKGKIQGRYLFGLPMKDAEVSWNLRRDHYFVEFPEYKEYSFSGYTDEEESEREILGSGSGQLNQDGEFGVQVTLSPKDIVNPSIITLEGTVTAPNKRRISGRQNWVVYPANLLIGLKLSEYLHILGNPVNLELITIRPSGEKVGDKRVDIKIVKVEWRSIKKARLGGRYEWVCERIEEEVKRYSITSHIDPVQIKFTPKEPGYYYILAKASDEKGRTSYSRRYFYTIGKGEVGWEMSDTDIIELVPDKDVYEVGDKARILVKSPYDSATALITVERELVLRRYVKKLHGNADYIEIPIKSIDLPNIYVCVILVRGRTKGLLWDEEKQEDLGKPQYKIGYVNLKVSPKEKHLIVKARSDKEEYRPRDVVTISYEVNDYKGRPVANSEVALFVVDLGVLNLIDFKTPDPFDYFYASRPLSVKTIESRINILGERNYGEKGEERGGGGAYGGIRYREKFLTTAYYKGDLKTDRSGKGKVTFELPDNLTRFRIMVVAQTKDSKFGKAESNFTVNLPFIVTDSLPRCIRVSDEFKAGVVLHNRTERESSAWVKCRVNKGVRIIDKDEKEVILPPGGSKEVLFSFVAEEVGDGVFRFEAKMGKEKDALKLTIPIKSPPFIEAVATFSSTEESALEGIIVPSNIYEDIGGLEILLSSSVLAGMQRGIEHLLEYPYGCLEQKVSRILPLVVGEEIINRFKLAPVLGKELRDTVKKVLDEIPEYQASNGGFLFFKGSAVPCPYLSAYTMYVLKRCKESGYKIDPKVVEKGKGYLKSVLRWNAEDWTYPYNEYAKLLTLSFCVYSLSLWGEREPGYASKLFEKREQIPVFGKVLLLRAGRRLNMGKEFEGELVRIITNKLKFSPTGAHFEEAELRGWTFPSPAKVTGYVIQTFTELEIPFPYKAQVIRWLVQERGKKTKPTTHENAFVFDAFQTYYKRYEREEPSFVAKVILEKDQILKETFKGRTNAPPKRFLFPLNKIPKNKHLPLKIIKDGRGILYYTLRMIYAFKENPLAFDEGFYILKEILTLDGKKVDKFKRGEIYKVVLHIVVPETRIFAVVDDPLPAGFEVVQTSFATEAIETQEHFQREEGERKGHWWGSFDHQEYYDDRVLFFGQQLFPGEHTLVYFVRAGTSGKFLVPATKAEEMYSPEVFGSTTQGYIVIE